MKYCVALLALSAFFLGSSFAQDDASKPAPAPAAKEDLAAIAKALMGRQQELIGDMRKITRAAKDIKELRDQRATGRFTFNEEERKLEKTARMEFHLFMERVRNNTLEVLAVYDRVLGKEGYIDPLRKVFGKSLYQSVNVNWDEQSLDDIVDELIDGYGVKMFIKGNVDSRRTINLRGNMTLMSILLQIENVFNAKLTMREGELWFVRADIPDAEKGVEEKD